jgi:hypothetical protein
LPNAHIPLSFSPSYAHTNQQQKRKTYLV